ncbi:uncharacterized protein LOC110851742 [Folsomia candida]|uniref:uncharacterized protein LOC110851742 n=1 Tax=Folsomia candida TaxID=158441 RepID=UPI000B901A44|nr:uncharacterized protein LOC110851742 [Folsomia candida]
MSNYSLKVVILVGFICCVSGRTAVEADQVHVPEEIVQLGSALTARAVSWLVLHRLKTGNFRLENLRSDEQEGRIAFTLPIPLPPLPDPINIPTLELPLNLSGEGFALEGLIATCTPQIVGLSGMSDDLVVGYDTVSKTATIDMTLGLPSISLDSMNYLVDLLMKYAEGTGEQEMTFAGTGKSSLGLAAFFITLEARAQIPLTSGEYMSLDHLHFDMGFDSVILDFENFLINGQPVPLDNVARIIKSLFDTIWGTAREGIVESTRCLIDHAINDCTPLDLISGVYDCLKLLPLHPPCFGSNGADLIASMEALTPRPPSLSYCVPVTGSTTTQAPETTPTSGETGTSPQVTSPTTPEVTTPEVTTPSETTVTTPDSGVGGVTSYEFLGLVTAAFIVTFTV